MGTATKVRDQKKNSLKFLDIKRRSRDISKLYGRAVTAKEPEDRVVRRMCGLVVSEATWLVEVLAHVKLKAEDDAKKFKDIQVHLAKLHEDYPDEIERNLFIPSMEARIVADYEWMVKKIEELGVVPKDEKPKEDVLEDDSDE